jgi:conjugative transfer signal peptidase TraF
MKRCWLLRFTAAAIGSATLLGVCLIGAWMPAKLGYCLNITPSEPVGIYRRIGGGVERGALVLLNQPRDSAASILGRYLPANIPLIKRIAAIPDDLVEVNAKGVRVNGILWPDSAPLTHDQEGRSLRPYSFGISRVPSGQIWVMSNHPRGLDSRYFGPVAELSVISRLVPIATWPNPDTAAALDIAYALCVAAIALVLAATTVKATYTLIIQPREVQPHEVKEQVRRFS